LTIGTLADQTGCTVPTIRYYEDIGLLPQLRRGEAVKSRQNHTAGNHMRRIVFTQPGSGSEVAHRSDLA
jgi:hypothetical protein